MDFTRLRALGSLFSMLNQSCRNVLNYNHTHPDFPMQVYLIILSLFIIEFKCLKKNYLFNTIFYYIVLFHCLDKTGKALD